MAEDLPDIRKPNRYSRELSPPSDPDILSPEQMEKLEDKLMDRRREDVQYLRNHEEIRAIISEIMNEVTRVQSAEFIDVLGDLFMISKATLIGRIKNRLRQMDLDPLLYPLTKNDEEFNESTIKIENPIFHNFSTLTTSSDSSDDEK